MKRLRAGISEEDRRKAARLLRPVFARHVALPDNAVVAGYAANGSELDPSLLLRALEQEGRTLALPVVVSSASPLEFRRYRSGDPLIKGAHGIFAPGPDAPGVRPTHVLVPLLAFDDLGFRLGYGGGYYDRTLAALRLSGVVRAVGIGFAQQRVSFVPRGPVDEPLDVVLTERGAFGPEAGERP